jgi:hypothetical protein
MIAHLRAISLTDGMQPCCIRTIRSSNLLTLIHDRLRCLTCSAMLVVGERGYWERT